MKQGLLLFLLFSSFQLIAQKPETPRVCGNLSNEEDFSLYAKNKVRSSITKQIDKKTGRAVIEAIREYTPNGCLSKTVYPDADNFAGGRWSANVWTFSKEGFPTGYKQLWYDKDSAEVVYHNEWYVLDSGRYTEKHYRYTDPRPNYDRGFDREDLLYVYDKKGYELIMHHVKMKGNDTMESSSHYFKDGGAEPWRNSYRRYSPGGKGWTLTVTDEKKRVLKSVMYNGQREVQHYVYEFKTNPSGRVILEKQYEIIDGKKKLKREVDSEDENRWVTTVYEDGKRVNSYEEVFPISDPVPDEGTVSVSSPCKEFEETTTRKTGEKVITRWSECEGQKGKQSVYTMVYSPGGLLMEQETEHSKTEHTYFFETIRKGKH